MTHHPTRKQFFAKLLGAVAAAGAAPEIFAGSVPPPLSAPITGQAGSSRRFELRPDARAVARRDAA